MLAFQEILGHDTIKQHFQKAIELHKVSHAYILSGEAGMGRKSLAHAFALTLLCEKGGSQPCMNCHACKQVLSGNHPDLIHVTHEKPSCLGSSGRKLFFFLPQTYLLSNSGQESCRKLAL